ncbi:hypothetical protein BBP40_009957 [Aspergillus hancockii]|nr:hypothetical protein BBP40_009957 [Aspergillus hancockii]
MNPQPDTSTNFSPPDITRGTFKALLNCYPATVEAVSRRKATNRIIHGGKRAKKSTPAPLPETKEPELDDKQKSQVEAEVKAFSELDEFRYESLPGLVKGRAPDEAYLGKEELVRVVEWKLKHGVFRPALLGMVKSNQAKSVQRVTSEAFAAVAGGNADSGAEFPKSGLDALVNPLRGVGVATASLLLSVGPREAPFYSDDTYLWLCLGEFPRAAGQEIEDEEKKPAKKVSAFKENGEINVKYDVSEYRRLWDAVNALRTRLNADKTDSEADVSCADIEKVAFVLRHLDVSGYWGDDDREDLVLILADERVHEPQTKPGAKKRKRGDEAKAKKGERNTKKKTARSISPARLLNANVRSNPLQSSDICYELGVFGAHPTQKYESFDLEAPEVNMRAWDPRCEDSYVFLSPRGHFYPEPGPLIYDNKGELVWIEKRFGMAMDFKVQSYRGQDYLTFWAGEDDGTRGLGVYYMLDSSYEVAHIVTPANGRKGDLHEFTITPDGTALITNYEITQADLTSVGGPATGWIYDGLFQEIDLETGACLFEWRASDHYSINETYFPLAGKGSSDSAADAFDYFHINSVDKHPNGNYLVSSRYMHTVTCVSPVGEILWILGGKRNMFVDVGGGGSATGFKWQHDARWRGEDVITVLDNGAHEHLQEEERSFGMMIELGFGGQEWTARTMHVYPSPGAFSSHSQGNVQVLPRTGNVFVGWGKASAYTEFSVDGREVLCDAHWGPRVFFWLGWVKSYRAYKDRWVGRPSSPPDVAVDEALRVMFVSWNGATEVAGWLLQRAEVVEGDFKTVDYVPKSGFETAIELDELDVDGYLRLVAVDFAGDELGHTRVLDVSQTVFMSSTRWPMISTNMSCG